MDHADGYSIEQEMSDLRRLVQTQQVLIGEARKELELAKQELDKARDLLTHLKLEPLNTIVEQAKIWPDETGV